MNYRRQPLIQPSVHLREAPGHLAAPPNQHQGHIHIQDLRIVFGQGRKQFVAIEQVSLTIQSGEFVCLIGPSGCGKSTVLNTIAGFIQPTMGLVKVDGYPVERPGRDRGMVFQQPSLFPWKTVLQNVAHGPLMAGLSKANAHRIAQDLLQMVGLSRFAKSYPMTLSGGMQQRVAIARSLANYPRVLLMDEPFGALDAQTRVMMQENLLTLWDELQTTVVFVTHDLDEAILLADRIIVISAHPGRVLADIPIPLPRPRNSDLLVSDAFTRLKRDCFELIRQESMMAFANQYD
jgi:NitT/TauT family transport system ATP-binding protein